METVDIANAHTLRVLCVESMALAVSSSSASSGACTLHNALLPTFSKHQLIFLTQFHDSSNTYAHPPPPTTPVHPAGVVLVGCP